MLHMYCMEYFKISSFQTPMKSLGSEGKLSRVAIAIIHNIVVLVSYFHDKSRIKRRYLSCDFVTSPFYGERVFLSVIEKNMPRNLCISSVEVVLHSKATALCA